MSSCVCGCVGQKSVIREIDQQKPLSACVLFGRKSLAELIVNSQQLSTGSLCFLKLRRHCRVPSLRSG